MSTEEQKKRDRSARKERTVQMLRRKGSRGQERSKRDKEGCSAVGVNTAGEVKSG